MAPRRKALCEVCDDQESKYSCPACFILYCSVKCFKKHKEKSCSGLTKGPSASSDQQIVSVMEYPETKPITEGEEIPDASPLRPLTSLKWPYIPDEPSFDDPLKRDEPKPLRLPQYEAIATSPAIRAALTTNPNLPALLRNLDKLRGTERQEALERLLGVSMNRSTSASHDQRFNPRVVESEEDINALKQLAEAVESCVRGKRSDALGLDWADDT